MTESWFIYDSLSGKGIPWDRLSKKLSSLRACFPLRYFSRPDKLYLNLVAGLASGIEVALLQSPEQTGSPLQAQLRQTFPDPESLLAQIKVSEAKVGVFSSGTGGERQLVWHRLPDLLSGVRTGPGYAQHRWGMGWNPAHTGGLQVFLQAFLHQNHLCSLFGLEAAAAAEAIREQQLSHLSGTPTFFRMLSAAGGRFEQVVRVSLGGEPCDPGLLERLQLQFPNAQLRNLYTSSEARVSLASSGDIFSIPAHLQGKVKVDYGELMLHRSAVACPTRGEWYGTGDLVEIVEESPLRFRFASRKDRIIQIGGYAVDPGELESTLQAHPEVLHAVARSQANAVTGQILTAEVVLLPEAKLSEKALRAWLRDRLPPYKIPALIHFSSQIQFSPSGKAKSS